LQQSIENEVRTADIKRIEHEQRLQNALLSIEDEKRLEEKCRSFVRKFPLIYGF